MRILLILLTILMAVPTMADTLTWNPPTAREDGTVLDPATEISEYRLYCDTVTSSIPGLTATGSYELDKASILPDYGLYDCYLTAVDLEGRESTASNTVSIEWRATPPNAPTNLLLITE